MVSVAASKPQGAPNRSRHGMQAARQLFEA
jgi:hypothetical protein